MTLRHAKENVELPRRPQSFKLCTLEDPIAPFLRIYPKKIPINVAGLLLSMSTESFFYNKNGKYLNIH